MQLSTVSTRTFDNHTYPCSMLSVLKFFPFLSFYYFVLSPILRCALYTQSLNSAQPYFSPSPYASIILAERLKNPQIDLSTAAKPRGYVLHSPSSVQSQFAPVSDNERVPHQKSTVAARFPRCHLHGRQPNVSVFLSPACPVKGVPHHSPRGGAVAALQHECPFLSSSPVLSFHFSSFAAERPFPIFAYVLFFSPTDFIQFWTILEKYANLLHFW